MREDGGGWLRQWTDGVSVLSWTELGSCPIGAVGTVPGEAWAEGEGKGSWRCFGAERSVGGKVWGCVRRS
jgi:hypothetical protein